MQGNVFSTVHTGYGRKEGRKEGMNEGMKE